MDLPSSYEDWCKVLKEDPAAVVRFARAKLEQHKDVIRAGRSLTEAISPELDDDIMDVPMEPVAASDSRGLFRFGDLPPEIRNRIYQLALVQPRPIGIKSKYCLIYRGRPTFQPSDSEQSSYYTGEFASRTEFDLSTKRRNILTTYTFDRRSLPESIQSPLECAFLSVNRQIWHEAAPIFYGENTFRFESMNAIMPFLQDQSPSSLKLIRNLQFVFRLVEPDYQLLDGGWTFDERPYCAEPRELASICSDLGQVEDLRLRSLSIILDDRTRDFHYIEQWDRILCESINDLDALGVTYHGFPGDYIPHDLNEYALIRYNLHCSHMEAMFWNFMAPRMLRNANDEQDPDMLQHRNIRHGEFVEMLSSLHEQDSNDAEAADSPIDALSITSSNLSEPSLD